MSLDKRYLVWSLSFAAVGLILGIFMAATGNHSELVAHAHILMIGFVLSFVYGIIHRLWLLQPGRALANLQFLLHQVSAIVVSLGLFLIYGNFAPAEKVEPVLGVATFGILLAMLLMIYMVVKFTHSKATA